MICTAYSFFGVCHVDQLVHSHVVGLRDLLGFLLVTDNERDFARIRRFT
jgi:hypothetical protein